jgi:hypothetical protein
MSIGHAKDGRPPHSESNKAHATNALWYAPGGSHVSPLRRTGLDVFSDLRPSHAGGEMRLNWHALEHGAREHRAIERDGDMLRHGNEDIDPTFDPHGASANVGG